MVVLLLFFFFLKFILIVVTEAWPRHAALERCLWTSNKIELRRLQEKAKNIGFGLRWEYEGLVLSRMRSIKIEQIKLLRF